MHTVGLQGGDDKIEDKYRHRLLPSVSESTVDPVQFRPVYIQTNSSMEHRYGVLVCCTTTDTWSVDLCCNVNNGQQGSIKTMQSN